MSTEEPVFKSRRRRARRACEPCRQRKRKCDGREPCQTCIEAEYDCFFAAESSRFEARRLNKPRGAVHKTRSEADEHTPITASSATLDRGTQRLSDSEMGNTERVSNMFLDPVRSRYVSASSAVAFPRILGVEFAQGPAPRVHSFAWNLGVRAELSSIQPDVTKLLSLEQAKRLSDVYFTVVHPCFSFLKQTDFERDCTSRWLGSSTDREIDAIICGVSALGSFFSGDANQIIETALVEHAREILQSSSVLIYPTLKNVGAWILRTIYLRLTTRPHASWIASCTSMHISEATGLHKDLSKGLPKRIPIDNESRRRIFWTAWSLHTILSLEYGRVRVDLPHTCEDPSPDLVSQSSLDLLAIARTVAGDRAGDDQTEKVCILEDALVNLKKLTVHSSISSLIRADMVFSIYRHLRLLHSQFTKDQLNDIIDIGYNAMPHAQSLVHENLPWWNVISTPFQYACVLLAIDSPESLSVVSEVMTILEDINKAFDTHMVREATRVARSLIKMARDRKAEDLKKLDSCVPTVSEQNQNIGFPDLGSQPFLNWPDDPFDWDILYQQVNG